MSDNYISPNDWISRLKSAQENKELDSPHSVIVAQGYEYLAVAPGQMQEGMQKLSVSEITDLSEKKFNELEVVFKNGQLARKEFVQKTADLVDYSNEIIDRREAKRNQPWKQLMRGIALVICAVAAVCLIGIYFFIQLRRQDQQFQREIEELRKTLSGLNSRAAADVVVGSYLKKVPNYLATAKNNTSNASIAAVVSGTMNDYFRNYQATSPKPARLHQFAVDMLRGNVFKRTDANFGLVDTQPLPNQTVQAEKRVEAASQLIKELIRTKEDTRWEIPLQLAANQTSLNGALFGIIAELNVNGAEVQWQEEGSNYSLKAESSGGLPPIALEIVRDPITGAIEKAHVEVKSSLDIVKFNTEDSSEEKTVIRAEAVKANLKYTMTLADDHSPVISDLELNYTQ